MRFLSVFLSVFVLLSIASCNSGTDLTGKEITSITANTVVAKNGETMTLPKGGTVIVLVRHAEKEGGGADPQLLPSGLKRANLLSDILKDYPMDRIYTTSTNRTIFTAMPTARAKKKPNIHYAPKKYYELFDDKMFGEHKAKYAVVVGHSNTIPGMLNVLVGEERYEEIPETDYDNIYVVVTKGLGNSEVFAFKY